MGYVRSQGSTISVHDGLSPGTYVQIGEVTSIRDLFSGTPNEQDVTTLSSLAKEYALGLKDEGTMSLDVFYDPNDDGQTRCRVLRSSGAEGQFQIALPSTPAKTFSFNALVATAPFSLAVDTVATGTITLRVTGDITES
jgi:hypothetical protein